MNERLSVHREFERVILDLLSSIIVGGVTTEPSEVYDLNIDGGYAVEIKYYRTHRPQHELLRISSERLVSAARRRRLAPVLIVSCALSVEQREQLEEGFGVAVFSRDDILFTAGRFPSTLAQLSPLLEDVPYEDLRTRGARDIGDALVARSEGIVRSNDPNTQPEGIESNRRRGRDLCLELRALACGRKTWRAYELLSEQIVDFLFGGHFIAKSTQKITDDGLSRYDLIARATPKTEFWNFVVGEMESRYVVFEFKNYCAKISQGQILTTEKYLVGHALRKCAFVFCRKGASSSADKMVRGAVRESGKLIIILSDDDLCTMLHMKDAGSDPTDYLFQRADEVFMTLSR